MDLSKFLELSELAREEAERYPKKRYLYTKIVSEKGKHFIGIAGPRGVGKTVILKQIARENKDAFYLSVDTLEGEEDLFEIAKILAEQYGINLLLLDEIHFQKNYEQKLKKIFDFLNVHLVFTSSVSLSIFESSYDLSRRVKLFYLYPFSLREYLFFKKSVSLPALTLERIIKKQRLEEYLRYKYAFPDYLKGNLLPFSFEEPNVYPILGNIIERIIEKDIPSVANLQFNELGAIEKVIKFIGKSPVDGINFTSLSKNIGITKYKAEQYVNLLEKAFVLNVVFPAGTNVLKEPKILMYLPYRLLYKSYDESLGALREDFFAEALKMRGWEFNYLKTKRGAKTPDFLVRYKGREIVVEIGGRGKGRSQFKGVTAKEKVIFTHSQTFAKGKRPLFLLGFIN